MLLEAEKEGEMTVEKQLTLPLLNNNFLETGGNTRLYK